MKYRIVNLLSPRFLKKAKGILLSPLSVCLLCYLLLNHWAKFNQIWCVSYSHEWGVQRQFFFVRPPRALRRGQKVKYHLISITKSIWKIFIQNFVCVLTNERYKTYQMGFSFCRLGHALGVGLGVLMGPKLNSIRRSVRCAISSLTIGPNSTKFGVCDTHMHEACNSQKNLAPPPGALGRGQKVKYHLISITKSIFKDFYTKLCVCSHK